MAFGTFRYALHLEGAYAICSTLCLFFLHTNFIPTFTYGIPNNNGLALGLIYEIEKTSTKITFSLTIPTYDYYLLLLYGVSTDGIFFYDENTYLRIGFGVVCITK